MDQNVGFSSNEQVFQHHQQVEDYVIAYTVTQRCLVLLFTLLFKLQMITTEKFSACLGDFSFKTEDKVSC